MLRKLALKNLLRPVIGQHFQSIVDFSQNSETIDRIKKDIEESKKSLKWSPQADERPDEWNSKFKLFSDGEQTSDFITIMQQPIDLSPSAVKKWYEKRKERTERHMQSYIKERHEMLGSDLATAHFIVYRGGAVKFNHKPDWIRADENGEYVLPKRYEPTFKVEGLRCDNMVLYYEGLENVRRLSDLKFWSLRNVKTFDDWCLDRLCGAENPKLEVLDLSGTNITYRGLSAIYKLENLKILIVDDKASSKEMELSCAMLESEKYKLRVCNAKEIHDIGT